MHAARHTITYRVTALISIAILFAAGWISFGPDIIDDAYITFRYSRNIAWGDGFTYNPGERVQGASSPLWTLVLAGGPPNFIPRLALILNALGAMAALALIVVIGRAMGRELAGWLAAALMAAQLLWIQNAVSGMETPLYQALLLGLFAAVGLGRWRWIGPLAALAMLTRYDGALAAAAALGVAAWRAGWRMALREAAIAAALYLPWFAGSWLYFGSPIPQSVQAKHLQTGLTWAQTWWHWRVIAKFMALPLAWLALAAVGAGVVCRRRDGWIVLPVWIALYAGAFAMQRMPLVSYPWYFVPLIPPLALLGVIGLESLCRLPYIRFAPTFTPPTFAPLALLLFILLLSFSIVHLREEAPLFGRGAPERREALYFRTAAALRPHLRPGDTILVGEVGALGWALDDVRVIDSPGLVSRDTHAINAALSESSESARTLRMLETLRPDFVSTKPSIMNLQALQGDPWFADHYALLTDRDLVGLDQWTFAKRAEDENHP